MMTLIVSFFLITGSIFCLVASIGVVRMPDLYCRMHAATKAGAFGSSLIMLAIMLALPGVRTIAQGLMIIVFFYLTAPIAAQMIGRAARLRGNPVWTRPADPSEGNRQGESSIR